MIVQHNNSVIIDFGTYWAFQDLINSISGEMRDSVVRSPDINRKYYLCALFIFTLSNNNIKRIKGL